MNIIMGPTGRIVKGDVLDCNKAALERAVKDYDSNLYISWNPKKARGYGCWELRRRPDKKTLLIDEMVEFDNKVFIKVDYKENNVENHVKDLPILDYRIIEWLKMADTWKQVNYEHGKEHRAQQWALDLERAEKEYQQAYEEKMRKEVVYNMLQYKTAIQQYREAILSGTNPADLAKYWK